VILRSALIAGVSILRVILGAYDSSNQAGVLFLEWGKGLSQKSMVLARECCRFNSKTFRFFKGSPTNLTMEINPSFLKELDSYISNRPE